MSPSPTSAAPEPDPSPDGAAADVLDAEHEADARALASVVRMRILRLCLDEPRTNKEIAERLGRDPATVLHHVRTLVDRGFLAAQPVRRGTRGSREIPYLATRKSWHAPRLPAQERVLIDAFLEEVAEADPASVATTRLGLRLGPEARAELDERLSAVLEEFAAREPDPEGTPWSLFLAVHEDSARLGRASGARRTGARRTGAPAAGAPRTGAPEAGPPGA
ncbi:ArsR/SmtB family transcription factor [Actinotalea solisilvae]|uniref:ArsR/SmtB family transcription factor n=1 Tax=Actinotalea solisilvae TaxID=2072922 RepID=UPI0027DB7B8B|nr:helix-turn-helix domain-containing protein [Actinotalea solisilvae]